MKKSFILAMILVLIVASLTFIPFKTKANIIGGGLDIGARAEVSKDNGATWYNFSADSNPGGQTLVVSPGDTLLFRGKVWNGGESDGVNLVFNAIIDHPEYLEGSVAFYDDDEDRNGVHYTGYINGTVTLPSVSHGTNENVPGGYESGTFQVNVRSDAPDQGVIEGIFEVIQIGLPTGAKEKSFLDNLIPRAYAQMGTARATVKILISNNLPQTGSANN